MKRTVILIMLFCFTAGLSKAYPINELSRLNFIPRWNVINSSALVNGASAPFINPANLSELDRVNFNISTGESLMAQNLSLSAIISYVGGVSIGIYQAPLPNSGFKSGSYFGWGKEWLDYLSAGLSFRTVGTDIFDTDGNILFDIGVSFYPNESLAPFFGKGFFNNRLRLGLSLQNMGSHTLPELDEELRFRLGLGYDLSDIIWTKLFVESIFMPNENRLQFGFEFQPEIFRILSLRLAYDMEDILIGFSLNGDDFSVDAAYATETGNYSVSVTGYFERSKSEISDDLYNEGLSALELAEELDTGKENFSFDAFDKYFEAKRKLELALFYNKTNQMAENELEELNETIDSYWGYQVVKAEQNLNSGYKVSALVYFIRAAYLEETEEIRSNINILSTNSDVLTYKEKRQTAIQSSLDNENYAEAEEEIEKLSWILPRDPDVLRLREEVTEKMRETAMEYYETAETQYNNGNYSACISTLDSALDYWPEYSDALNLQDKAQSAYNEQLEDSLIADLLSSAEAHYSAEEYVDAMEAINEILSYNSGHSEARDLKSEIEEKLEANISTYLAQGIDYYDEGEYESAIELFDLILAVDEDHSMAGDYRRKAVSKKEALEKLESYQD